MSPEKLHQNARQKQSMLCVGLDIDPQKIPDFLKKEKKPFHTFNKAIIEATSEYAIAYKPNLAFYEAMGPAGWDLLAETLEYIPDDIFVIADAKRGDIGNTSRMYARAFFEQFDFDAITVAPYMGKDSVAPFLEFENKWVFLLALTSNQGASNFQYLSQEKPLYQEVLHQSKSWSTEAPGELGFVVGATKAEKIQEIRQIVPQSWLLVPGIGAQGGDLQAVCQYGMVNGAGLLINSSRGIIYAGKERDFAQKAGEAAKSLQQQMAEFM